MIEKSLLRHASDYSYAFYPYGWRGLDPKGDTVLSIQTSRYMADLNGSSAGIRGLRPVSKPEDAGRAVSSRHDAPGGSQGLDVRFYLETGDALRAAYQAKPAELSVPDSPRNFSESPNARKFYLVESGRYLQHYRLGGIGFRSSGGADSARPYASLEYYCWPDRFSTELTLDHSSDDGSRRLGLRAEIAVPRSYGKACVLDGARTWREMGGAFRTDAPVAVVDRRGAGFVVHAVGGTVARDGAGHLVCSSNGSRRLHLVIVPSRDSILQTGLHEALQIGNPMTSAVVRAQPIGGDDTLATEYDPVLGAYRVHLKPHADPLTPERMRLKLTNPDSRPRTVRLSFAKLGLKAFPYSVVIGSSPVMRDGSGYPIGLPIQISKDWGLAGEDEKLAWFDALTMVHLEPRQSADLELTIAHAYWGGAPAVSHSQLSLIAYGVGQLWDEMAIGSFGESICYDPDVNLNRSMIDDMRPLMVYGPGRSKWGWTDNVGGADFLTLFTKGKAGRQFLGRQRTLYKRYCPVMSEVIYAGQTPDGAIQSRVTARSWRTDDYVRALYTLRYDVVSPVKEIDRLAFFQLGADGYNGNLFGSIQRGHLGGLTESWAPVTGGLRYSRRSLPLDGETPWLAVSGSRRYPTPGPDDGSAWANRGMVVRSWKARLGGKDCPSPFYSVYGSDDCGIPSAVLELSPPAGLTHLETGDYVEAQVEMVILPIRAEDYYGPNESLRRALTRYPDSWQMLYREVVGSHVSVTASGGTVEQSWPVIVKPENGRSIEFDIRGGVGYTPVTITGAAGYAPFVLEVLRDGKWVPVDQSKVGNDWWQADYVPASGAWDLTFTLPLDELSTSGMTRLRWRLLR